MYAAIFKKGNGNYVFMESYYQSKIEEEALMKGLLAQAILAGSGYLMEGKCHFITDKEILYPVKEILDLTGREIHMGLISGADYDSMKEGKQITNILYTSEELYDKDLFVVSIIKMKNKENNVKVAIGYEKGTYDPYVVVMGMNEEEALTPQETRNLCNDLVYAAEASQLDSFLRRALDEAYETEGDDGMSNTKKDELVNAIRNIREQERNNEQIPFEEDTLEKDELTIESNELNDELPIQNERE